VDWGVSGHTKSRKNKGWGVERVADALFFVLYACTL